MTKTLIFQAKTQELARTSMRLRAFLTNGYKISKVEEKPVKGWYKVYLERGI
jgi:hypothetical protein